jgi:hypothetical protein
LRPSEPGGRPTDEGLLKEQTQPARWRAVLTRWPSDKARKALGEPIGAEALTAGIIGAHECRHLTGWSRWR